MIDARPATSDGSTVSAVLGQPQCADDPGSWCARVYDWTSVDWLSRHANTVIDTTTSILLILVVAYVLRWVLHRAISRLTTRVTDGRVSSLIRAQRAPRRQSGAEQPKSVERRAQRAGTIGSLLRSTATFVVFGVAFVMVLDEFGINVGPIIASAGVLGIAIGFGAQNLVRDFLSGIFMMLEDQYGVGDTVDLGEAIGDVEAVGLRTTTIRDISGTVWYVRNGEILRVGNFSQGFAIALVDIPLALQADVGRASELAQNAAREVAEVDHADDVMGPPELLGVQSVTPYAVMLRLTVRTRPGRQWAVQRALNARIQTALRSGGVPSPNLASAAIPQ